MNNNQDTDKTEKVDWIYLPKEAESKSLWVCLHDAYLQSICSNLLDRTVVLDFDVFYIQEHHHLPEDVSFIFTLKGVTSARINSFSVWPGEFKMPPNASWAEQERLVKEYQSKGREESGEWKEFEKLIQSKKDVFEVLDPELALNENNIALSLGGLTKTDDKYHSIVIRANKLTLQQSDGKPLTLEDFIKLGNQYWDAFSSKSGN